MNILTVAVACAASLQGGPPLAGAVFRAKLNQTETYQGFIVPREVTGTADANGLCILNLWPNALGVAGSLYEVTASHPRTGSTFLRVDVFVPASSCNLHEIIMQAPYPPLDASMQALVTAQGALAPVTAKAAEATSASAAAIAAASQANAKATEAAEKSALAESARSGAVNNAVSASNSATEADLKYREALIAANRASAAAQAAQTAAQAAIAAASQQASGSTPETSAIVLLATQQAQNSTTAAAAAQTALNQANQQRIDAQAAANDAGQKSANADNKAIAAATSAATANAKALEAAATVVTVNTKAAEALASAQLASTKAGEIGAAATLAGQNKDAAVTAKTAAETAKTASETAKTAAETARTAAQTAQTGAGTAKTAAETAATAAQTAKTGADTAATTAGTAASTATTAKTAAETARAEALQAKTDAETARTQAIAAKDAAVAAAAGNPGTGTPGAPVLVAQTLTYGVGGNVAWNVANGTVASITMNKPTTIELPTGYPTAGPLELTLIADENATGGHSLNFAPGYFVKKQTIVTKNTRAIYSLTRIGAQVSGGFTQQGIVLVQADPLAAPGSLTANAPTSASMKLDWQAVEGAAKYEVLRNGVVINQIVVTGLTYTDMGLQPSTQYAWTVRAVDAEGLQGALSNVATRTTEIEPASGGTAGKSLWFDATDISSTYQDATGLTTLTAAGQFIGRLADKSSGIHLLQRTAAARPVLGVRKINLLKSTADLGAAPWALNNMTHSNGTLTATNATTSFHRQFATTVPGTQYTFSFKAKKGTAADVKYSAYDATNDADIVAPTSYNGQINGSTDTLIQFTITAPTGCTNVAFYTTRNMTSLGTVIVKEPQVNVGAVALAFQAVTAEGEYGAAVPPLSISFDGTNSLAAENFAAGTLGADMDCFIPIKRYTSGKLVALYDNADNGEFYVGAMATTNGTVNLGSGAPTYAVNGNVLSAATRPAIEAAMSSGRWSLLEIRNANLSGWTGIGIGGYATFELNGSLGPVRIMPAQSEAARASIRESIMTTYGITAAPIVPPPASGDFYSTRVQNLLPMQKQIRQIYYEVYFGYTGQYTTNDIDSRFNEWVLFTSQPKVPAGWGNQTKDNYGDGTFVMSDIGEPNFSNDKLLAAHNRGVRIILSIGGAKAGFNIDTNARRQKLLDSIILMMSQLSAGSGVGNIISGISWNSFEAYLRGVYAANPANCTANTANIVWISQQLCALYGSNFSIHMPPASSMSHSPYDILVARALKATGLPFVAASQNYDDDYATKTPGVVGTNNKAWAAEMGSDSAMIGLACGFKGSYAYAMTLPFMKNELNTLMAAYPNLRGFFLWSQHDKINADMPAWMNYVIDKIPGKA